MQKVSMTEAKRGDMDLNDGGSSGIKSCPRIIFVVDGPLVANFFSLLQQGVKIILINDQETYIDRRADVVIRGDLTQILPQLVEAVLAQIAS